MQALTADSMNRMRCENPNCGHDHSVLYLNASCHPKAGVEVRYTKATAILTLECKKCKKVVADIAVAPNALLVSPLHHHR
jgi:hypothetical protein